MARVALLVLVVAAMAFTGEVVAQSTCGASIGFCPALSYFTQGSTCVNDTSGPVSINFTTIGALLTGASGSSLGLSAALTASLSSAFGTIGASLQNPASISWVPLGSLLPTIG